MLQGPTVACFQYNYNVCMTTYYSFCCKNATSGNSNKDGSDTWRSPATGYYHLALAANEGSNYNLTAEGTLVTTIMALGSLPNGSLLINALLL